MLMRQSGFCYMVSYIFHILNSSYLFHRFHICELNKVYYSISYGKNIFNKVRNNITSCWYFIRFKIIMCNHLNFQDKLFVEFYNKGLHIIYIQLSKKYENSPWLKRFNSSDKFIRIKLIWGKLYIIKTMSK